MNIIQIATLSLLLCCAVQASADFTDGGFEKTITKQVGLKYRTVFPDNYDSQEKYPLMIFLHGRGEQGDDLDKVQVHGPYKKVAEMKLPLIIVAPQSPMDERWEAEALSAMLDHLLETLPVDKSRIYLTGLSMGGEGTWQFATYRPDAFAAIAPICGWGAPSKAKRLKDVPTWIFHGGKDTVINFRESTKMANALYEVGNNARLTIYPDAGHDSWTESYNNPQLYEWFMSHQKK